jgi:hypothetical protein
MAVLSPAPTTFFYDSDWQVRSNEPALFHDNRAPQFPTTCIRPTGSQGWFNEAAARTICMNRGALLTLFVTGDPDVASLYDGKN